METTKFYMNSNNFVTTNPGKYAGRPVADFFEVKPHIDGWWRNSDGQPLCQISPDDAEAFADVSKTMKLLDR